MAYGKKKCISFLCNNPRKRAFFCPTLSLKDPGSFHFVVLLALMVLSSSEWLKLGSNLSILSLAGRKKDYEGSWVKYFKAQEWKWAYHCHNINMNTFNCSVGWAVKFLVVWMLSTTVQVPLYCYKRRKEMLWAINLLHQVGEDVIGIQMKDSFLCMRGPGKSLQ